MRQRGMIRAPGWCILLDKAAFFLNHNQYTELSSSPLVSTFLFFTVTTFFTFGNGDASPAPLQLDMAMGRSSGQ